MHHGQLSPHTLILLDVHSFYALHLPVLVTHDFVWFVRSPFVRSVCHHAWSSPTPFAIPFMVQRAERNRLLFHISQNTYISPGASPPNFTHKFRCGRNVPPSLAALNRRATTLGGADGLLPSLERGRGPRKNNSRSVLDPFPRRVVSKSLAPRFLVHLRRTVFSGLPSKIEQRLVIRSSEFGVGATNWTSNDQTSKMTTTPA
mmetsp:Transcript_2385/g.4847  ORF Transcript_2385/g.4847 Transcript_2385/m.4847 type:complete len:202 (-) Transcript_2385:155-760(-)